MQIVLRRKVRHYNAVLETQKVGEEKNRIVSYEVIWSRVCAVRIYHNSTLLNIKHSISCMASSALTQ